MKGPLELLLPEKEDLHDPIVRFYIEMQYMHNVFIRGLNSILIQALDIEPKDVAAFKFYCRAWLRSVEIHHTLEEEITFPRLEAVLGPNSLSINVQQHHEFEAGFRAFHALVEEESKWNPQSIIDCINEFTPVFCRHLKEEIVTIHPNKLKPRVTASVIEEIEAVHLHAVKTRYPMFEISVIFNNHDIDYGPQGFDGLNPSNFLRLFSRYVLYWPNRRSWKFCSCDRYGHLKHEFRQS